MAQKSGVKAIVVEDERMIREGILRIFDWNALGIQAVLSAENGEKALRICREEKPDVIVSDIRMPGMTGIELCTRLRDFLPEIQIIFISGYDDKEYLLSAIHLHALTYIEKPIDPELLAKALKQAANSVRQKKSDLLEEIATEQNENPVDFYAQPIKSISSKADYSQPSFIVKQIQEFIMCNFSDKNLSTQTIASAVCRSPTYISALFKEKTGITINQHIQNVRMEEASRMLKNPSLTVYQIAESVGYEDSNYFAKLFKKHSGLRPSEFRDCL